MSSQIAEGAPQMGDYGPVVETKHRTSKETAEALKASPQGAQPNDYVQDTVQVDGTSSQMPSDYH